MDTERRSGDPLESEGRRTGDPTLREFLMAELGHVEKELQLEISGVKTDLANHRAATSQEHLEVKSELTALVTRVVSLSQRFEESRTEDQTKLATWGLLSRILVTVLATASATVVMVAAIIALFH